MPGEILFSDFNLDAPRGVFAGITHIRPPG
jgi:hypothetical protein